MKELLPDIQVLSQSACLLGEGPLWDDVAQAVWWVDILGLNVHRLDWISGVERVFTVDEPLGFVCLSAHRHEVLLGTRGGLSLLDWAMVQTRRLSASAEQDLPNNRINDGMAMPDGAAIYGTMDFDAAQPTGSYWRYHNGQHTRLSIESCAVTNGPAISPDGNTLYTVDTMGKKIWAHAWNGRDAVSKRLLVGFDDPTWGYPDGIIADAQGYIWCGHFAGGRISRFSPSGDLDAWILMPTPNITKVAFCGDQLDTLVATSASIQTSSDPLAGCTFRMKTSYLGLQSSVAQGV
jgi:sugar lactone lactonase YvrE